MCEREREMNLKGQTRARVGSRRVSRADLTPSFPGVNSRRSSLPPQGHATPAGSQPPRGMAPEQLISPPLKEGDKARFLFPPTPNRRGRRAAGRRPPRRLDPCTPARGHRGEGQRVWAKFELRALPGSGEGRSPGRTPGCRRWSKEKKLPGEFTTLGMVVGGRGGGGGQFRPSEWQASWGSGRQAFLAPK